jgi:hypothetical protein
MKTLESLGEQLKSQVKALEAQGTSAVARVQERGRTLGRRIDAVRTTVDLGKLTPANLRAAAGDAAHAFAGHFRPAGVERSAPPAEATAAPTP